MKVPVSAVTIFLLISYIAICTDAAAMNQSESDNIIEERFFYRDIDETILNRINALRVSHGVPCLEIDYELKRAAQRCADDMALHDIDGITEDFTPNVEQMVSSCQSDEDNGLFYYSPDTDGGSDDEIAFDTIRQWMREERPTVWTQRGYTEATRHFTQLIWSSTTDFGCAVSSTATVTGNAKFFVCYFNPPGNLRASGSNFYFRSRLGQQRVSGTTRSSCLTDQTTTAAAAIIINAFDFFGS